MPGDRGHRWVLLAGVWLIYFCFGVMIAAMAPLVAPIREDLGIENTSMGIILGAWPLMYILAAVPCGILLDRFGERRVLLAATLIMAASGVARGLADSPEALFLAVALFGAGGPMISIGAPKLIAQNFQGPDRGTAMGLYITGPSLGGIAALSLTNSVMMPVTGQDWRLVLFLYSGLVAASGLVWLAISLRGGSLQGGRSAEGTEKFTFSAFAALLRVAEVRVILATSIGIFFVNHALNNWLPELLRSRGMDAAEAGYWASVPTVVGIAGSMIIPRLATPDRRLAIMTLLFCAAVLASLLLQANPGIALTAGLVLQGIARSSMMTIAILLLMETPRVPKERLGLAGGLFFTTAEIGGVLGPVTFGFLSDVTQDFTASLAAVTLAGLGLLVLVGLLKRVRAPLAPES